MKKIVLASSNVGKLAEFEALFAPKNIEIIRQSRFNIKDAIEDGLSFIENALIKARHASKLSFLPSIADDSGLCVPTLNDAPAIYSARWSGVIENRDQANNEKLLRELRGNKDRRAFYICALAFVRHENDPLPIIATGILHGEILEAPRGENGFGYDPLFFIPSLNKTAAELTESEKNAISHRAIALNKLMKKMENL